MENFETVEEGTKLVMQKLKELSDFTLKSLESGEMPEQFAPRVATFVHNTAYMLDLVAVASIAAPALAPSYLLHLAQNLEQIELTRRVIENKKFTDQMEFISSLLTNDEENAFPMSRVNVTSFGFA